MKKQVKKNIEKFQVVKIKKEQQLRLKGGIIHEDIIDG